MNTGDVSKVLLIEKPKKKKNKKIKKKNKKKKIKKKINGSCISMYMYQWFDCHLPGAVVSPDISGQSIKSCPGFPPPLDSRRLRSRIAKLRRNA